MRHEFGAKIKAAALKRCMNPQGVPLCECDHGGLRCKAPMRSGNLFFDHVVPDGLGGEPTLENCAVLCKTCHDRKTFGSDNPRMQKADRQRKKHFGLTGPKRKIPQRVNPWG